MLEFYLTLLDSESDKDKLTYIYEKYYKLMLYIANEYSYNESDSEDIVHESLMKIIDNLDKIDIYNDLSTKCYICTIIKNHAKDNNKHNHFIDDVDISTLESEADDDVIDTILSEEGYKNLLDCIERLDDKDRDVCNLKFVCGLKEHEISRILGITTNTVGVRINRSRKVLKVMLMEAKTKDVKPED
jgi:RNA polymerase sigma-70 factor (ECF subfamily)